MTARPNAGRRPRERIGADEARRWARQLDLGNPFAKAIMLAAANYMNEEGTAYPGTATLARDTDISEDTVVKRLRWLSDIGAIALFKCWRDENGQRNYEGRGKPTSSEIRFLFDADPDDIRARARGETVGDDGCETSEISPRPERGLDSGQPPTSPRLAPDQPPKSDPSEATVHMNARARLEQEHESQPQTPSHSEGALTPPIEDFQAAYPIPVSDLDKARMVWSGMTEAERNDAITGAAGYASLCRQQPRRTVEDAHRWLKNRKWQGYLVAGKAAEVIAKQATVPVDSPQGRIWQAVFDIATRGQGFPYFMLGGPPAERVATVPTTLPEALLSLATDRSTWFDVLEDGEDHRFHAWRRWLIGNVPNVKINYGPVGQPKRLRVPFDWPPRKDGSIGQSSDPPSEESTAA